jgi:hypothetical protein
MRSAVVALGCTVTVMFGLLALPATAARADSTATLPQLTSFDQMVVDSANGYVFLSEGISSTNLLNGATKATAIVVTDLSGTYITTLDAGDGVEGLALSSDGNTLYAALAATDQVAAIAVASGSITSTTTTPSQTLYDLGTGDVPYSLAVQSGKLWVSYNADPTAQGAPGFGAIGDIDLTSSSFEPATASASWYSPPDLAADPSDSNVLVAVQPGQDPATGATFNTATDPATALAASAATQCSFEDQIAVVPGGSQFIAGCENPRTAYLYSTANLAPGSNYANPGTGDPEAVAVSGNGTVAVGYSGTQTVEIYQPGGTLLNTLSVPTTGYLIPAALAFSADGSKLFAVDQDFSGGYSLTEFDNPTLNRSELTLTGPSPAVVGTTVTLTGSLTLGNSASPAGLTVAITRTNPGGTTTTLPSVQTASDGSFTFTDSPTATGNYTYTASYAGDTSTEAATATFQMTVALNKATISLTSPGVVTYGYNVTVDGKMSLTTGAPPTGTKLTVVRTQTGSTATKTFSVTTVANGGFTVTDSRPAIAKYTYTATYAGNATTPAAKAALTVTVERTAPSLSVTTSTSAINYGKSVTVTATLGSVFSDRWVSIYAGPAGQPKKLLKLGVINAQGHLSVSYTLSRNTTFYASFSGDEHNTALTVSHGVRVYALVYMSTSGYFKTVKISGTTFQVYHHTAHLNTYSRVVPDKAGECIHLEVQQYFSGLGWSPNSTYGCFTLNKSSVFTTYFDLTGATGAEYRIRTDYKGDGNNVATDGGWVYFEVVS